MPPSPGKEEKEEKAPKADDKQADGAIAPAVEGKASVQTEAKL